MMVDMAKNAKIYVAGDQGLVGSALVRNLRAKGYHQGDLAAQHFPPSDGDID